MLRVVLAALLAVALLATAGTALDRARRSRSADLAAGEAAELTGAVADLARSEAAVSRPATAARRVVDVAVPGGSPTLAPVDYVAIGGVPGRSLAGDTPERDAVAYRLAGGTTHVRWVPVDVRTPAGGGGGLAADDRPLVVRRPSAVVLSLVERAGRRVVLVRRR